MSEPLRLRRPRPRADPPRATALPAAVALASPSAARAATSAWARAPTPAFRLGAAASGTEPGAAVLAAAPATAPPRADGGRTVAAEEVGRDAAGASDTAVAEPVDVAAEVGSALAAVEMPADALADAEADAREVEALTSAEAAPVPEVDGSTGEASPAAEGEGTEHGDAERAPASPEEDAAFRAVVGRARSVAERQGHNSAARRKAADAQAAAAGPPNEVASQAAAAQVAKLAAREAPPFDGAGFRAALLRQVAALTPGNQKEAEDFKQSGRVGGVKAAVGAEVAAAADAVQAPVRETAAEAPDTSVATPKHAEPQPRTEPGAPPPDLGAAHAAPKPRGEAEVSLEAGSLGLDEQMAEAGISEAQLERSNEPEFHAALGAKQEAQAHAADAPVAYRAEETAILGGARAEAAAVAAAHTGGMYAVRQDRLAQVAGAQDYTRGRDEQQRAEVAQRVESIYARTKGLVEQWLSRLDAEANAVFDRGAEAARRAFEDFVDARMRDYKVRRYLLTPGGSALWLRDQFLDLPDEVNAFYAEGRALYLARMEAVVDEVAALVEGGLAEAHAAIDAGLREVREYVDSLPDALRDIGEQAAGSIQAEFDGLRRSVDETRDRLVDALAQKYVASLQQVDARIEEMKAANRGLVSRAQEAMAGVVATILQLRDMLLGLLARAAGVVATILEDPVGFVGNLVAGLKAGLMGFVANIAAHLQRGLIDWLFGALAEAGITMPATLDLRGILDLVLQVLGLTYAAIRARAVRLLGEDVVARLEQAAEIFRVLVTEGPAGLWRFVQDRLGALRDTVLEGIRGFLIQRVIVAGITWIIGLLNPASAFIKAARAIYDIVMFFVTRGAQIAALVGAVLDSMAAIAAGAIGAMASAVENALARALPVAIGFLASLLGLGGLSAKIREVIQRIQAPVHAAIDWVIQQAVRLARAVGGLFGGGRRKDAGGESTGDAEHDARVEAGLLAIDAAEGRHLRGGRISREGAEQVAAEVRRDHPVFRSLAVVDGGDRWSYAYTASPARTHPGEPKLDDDETAVDVETIFAEAARLGAVERHEPDEVAVTRLNPASVTHGRAQMVSILAGGNVPADRADAALRTIDQLFARALEETTPRAIESRFRSAGGVANAALREGGSGTVVNIHHVQRVEHHPGTFRESRAERMRIPANLRREIEAWLAARPGVTKQHADYQFIVATVREHLYEARHPDPETPLDWVDLVVATAASHRALHGVADRESDDGA